MNVINISEKAFKSLAPLKLSSDIFNTEAEMYIYDEKFKWGNKKFVLKRLYNDMGTKFSNKLYTVNELIDRKDSIGIEELVMPDKLVAVDNQVVGFTVPYVENINFQNVLDSSEFTREQKIEYFKQIGKILENMKNIRIYSDLTDFYLNDMHENNFILNTKTGKINAVDMDSCKINGNIPFPSRYLSPMALIYDISKYKKVKDVSYIGECFEIDENTEYYCYIIMILNYLYGKSITKLSIEEFYDYLSYLHSIGVSSELIDMFYLIFSKHDNVNPYEYLDCLSKIDGRSNFRVFEHIRKK